MNSSALSRHWGAGNLAFDCLVTGEQLCGCVAVGFEVGASEFSVRGSETMSVNYLCDLFGSKRISMYIFIFHFQNVSHIKILLYNI